MTKYNGTNITYDLIGNPTSYRDGITFAWQNGRQLASFTKSGATSTYKYNESGIRTKKTSGGVDTYYYLDGSIIMAEKRGNNWIYYIYDENGSIVGMTHSVFSNNSYTNTNYVVIQKIGDKKKR